MWRALLIGLVACGAAPTPLYPAGSDQDDGYGDLAQKSTSLVTGTDDAPPWSPHHHRPPGPPSPPAPPATDDPDDTNPAALSPRLSSYQMLDTGLTGVVEGTITWRGPRPTAPTTACGPLAPSVRVAGNGAAGGVAVYVEHVRAGRSNPQRDDLAGVVIKRGCDLAPALQIVSILPRAIVVHGDATAATLRISGARSTVEDPAYRVEPLEAGGRVAVVARRGLVRIEADDGSLSGAFVLAIEAPYYAITDDAGHYRIDELAPGSYDLIVVAAPVPTLRHGQVYYGPAVTVRRPFQVGARPARLDIALGP